MLDIKQLRKDINAVASRLKHRGFNLDVDTFTALEAKRKTLQVTTQDLENQRKTLSKAIGQAKREGGKADDLLARVATIGEQLKDNETKLQDVQTTLNTLLLSLPNLTQEDVPSGLSEEDNQEIRRWGEPRSFDFTIKDHIDLGLARGWMDFETAVKLSGSRFVVLFGQLARLQRALIQFMLDVHTTEHGYEEIYVPYLVNKASLYGTGQLPKFEQDLFQVQNGLSLISTAEIPVTNVVRDKIVAADELPIKYACHTPCFRSEAGSYGKDTRGMIRQHQFEKVELVWIVKPDDSQAAHEQLTLHAETILQKLELPYRVMTLCTGDLGFSASKTYDLEVWLPGQQSYREISSCSNMLDFQARRMQARWRNPETGKPELVHTLNGSGLAAGRALVAIMENYQDAENRIHIPAALRPYMGNVEFI
jgi:seryl-tRNA synthetase